MRFSLKWMLAAVAFVGFGCTALYNANQAWATVAFSSTVTVLLLAILGSIYSRWRAFYVGMCVFGWGYLILAYVPSRETVKPPTATKVFMDLVYDTLPIQRDVLLHRPFGPNDRPPGTIIWNRGPTGRAYVMPIHIYFQTIGHSLFALIFGIIGGAIGQWFARRAKCDSA